MNTLLAKVCTVDVLSVLSKVSLWLSKHDRAKYVQLALECKLYHEPCGEESVLS